MCCSVLRATISNTHSHRPKNSGHCSICEVQGEQLRTYWKTKRGEIERHRSTRPRPNSSCNEKGSSWQVAARSAEDTGNGARSAWHFQRLRAHFAKNTVVQVGYTNSPRHRRRYGLPPRNRNWQALEPPVQVRSAFRGNEKKRDNILSNDAAFTSSTQKSCPLPERSTIVQTKEKMKCMYRSSDSHSKPCHPERSTHGECSKARRLQSR